MTKAQEASASSFVEDAQSSLAQADGVDDSVDSHDLATSDGEAHHRDWSPIDGNDDSGRAIYQRWSRHYSQMGAILLEALHQPALFVHRSHSSSRRVTALTIETRQM